MHSIQNDYFIWWGSKSKSVFVENIDIDCSMLVFSFFIKKLKLSLQTEILPATKSISIPTRIVCFQKKIMSFSLFYVYTELVYVKWDLNKFSSIRWIIIILRLITLKQLPARFLEWNCGGLLFPHYKYSWVSIRNWMANNFCAAFVTWLALILFLFILFL